jgi:IclR family pca regulon transcriptional regulator
LGEDNRDFVRALARGLAVIESFEGQLHAASLSEIATRAKLSRGTVRRSLITLEALGFVHEERGRFTLTPRTLRLGYSYLSSQPIWTLARNYVEEMHEETGETTSMAVLEDGMIVYVLRIVASRLLHDKLAIGSRLPAYPASMGRLLLADLPQPELDRYLRETELRVLTPYTVVDPDRLRGIILQAGKAGYAVSDQEMELGLRSIAVPIKGPDGRTVAALNIGCSSVQTSYVEMEMKFLPVLRKVAARIDELLRHHGRTLPRRLEPSRLAVSTQGARR